MVCGEALIDLVRLGDDAFAGQLRSHLRANGVGTGLAVDAAQPTSLAVVSLDAAGKASYTFMAGLLDALAVRDLPLPEALRRGARAAALACERQGADPPTRAQLDAALA